MSFYLQQAKAVLEKATSARISIDDNQVELNNGLQIRLKLDDQGTHDAAEFFFPGYDIVQDRIADLEGKHPGMKATIKLSPPAMTFVIYDGDGVNKVFQLRGSTIKGNVAFSITAKGNSALRMTINTKLTKDEMAKLHDFIGADILVSALEMQPDMFSGSNPDASSSTASSPVQVDLENELMTMTGSDMREQREKRGWTRDALAAHVGISTKSVGRYERGDRMLPPDIGEKAAAIFAQADSPDGIAVIEGTEP